VVVPADPATLTIDPTAAAARRTAKTRALIATHLFGIPADIPALQKALPGLPIVEDCCQSFGSTLDGNPVGSFGDAAIFSFGPGKRHDVGELGALVLRDRNLREQALLNSAHPIRQQVSGIITPDPIALSIRPHPLAAVLLSAALRSDDTQSLIANRRRVGAQLALVTDLQLVGVDPRRGVASTIIPVLTETVDERTLPVGTTLGHQVVWDIETAKFGRPMTRSLLLVSATRDFLAV
jgi:dTDP-4-amino-4,6-dideoxygalactose transaminase